jgi:hypothetical protein
LAQIPQNNTMIANTKITIILTIYRNWFEGLFTLDQDFARQVLGKETSKILQNECC